MRNIAYAKGTFPHHAERHFSTGGEFLNRKEANTMYRTLLDLEKDFFKYDKITDRTWLDSTLHDKFKEVGKSGIIFYKKDTINSLMALKADRNIAIFNFEFEELKAGCWIVHYITKDSDDKLFYRTSIWVKENNLKIIFHQASKLNSGIHLENTDMV